MNEIKSNRIDEFRQFKQRIRGSTEELVVGLDIGKRKHHAFFGNANGKTVLKGLIVENNAEGFRHLLSQVGFYMQRDSFKRVVFGLEPPASITSRGRASHRAGSFGGLCDQRGDQEEPQPSGLDGRWDKNDTKD